ncbi:MAG TPA: hypothetical protein VFO06_10090 [Gemmatimonadales bacterium]|jgi:hypothetical protein|nr:hypothetical protein [Gemmatimonadales bacterium]
MARFLIEVPHGAAAVDCTRAVEVFLRTGSHFLTHADWGCQDGDHRAWIILEVDSRDEALNVVPPIFQAQAKIVRLNNFTMQDLEQLLQRHKA